MEHGFVKVAAVTPDVRVADCIYNTEETCKKMKEAAQAGAKIIVFPELNITAYTCGDLFFQDALLRAARQGLARIVRESEELDALIFVGLPWEKDGKLYNVAAAVAHGRLLGVVPKQHLPNYAEFYEARQFAAGNKVVSTVDFEGEKVPFGANLLFECVDVKGLLVAAEICEDFWVPNPPSISHALAGATVIVNLSASDEKVGKNDLRRLLVSNQSARLVCGYIYASAGSGESTTDLVFGGHKLIAEKGSVLADSTPFMEEICYTEIDVQKLCAERRKMSTFCQQGMEDYVKVPFRLKKQMTKLTRVILKHPFVPEETNECSKRCEEIFRIQAMGLKKRLQHTGCRSMVIGISGGLDSTLALLAAAKAADLLELPRTSILAVTMPCFGTTDRTYRNACELAKKLGTILKEVNIREAVSLHFKDIGQDSDNHDVTYENAQARERTQVLMDLANQTGGMVIGTGDLSELVLGWATYNGDHMSMYAVNGSVPKTLVRHLVQYYADTCGDEALAQVLQDVLATPVSPELLPPQDGEIAQKTEDLVGPYELHDFFLYRVLRFGETPSKVYRLACHAFEGIYEKETILHWLKKFYTRFFSQQFKRSCLPDGPKVGSVAVSPRGDLRMPSDACVAVWMQDLEENCQD